MRGSRPSQQFGSLFIDHEAHEVCLSGHPIHLTLSEFILLTTLAEYPRRAFSNEYLTRILTRSDWVDETHALQATVSRLRRKLGESGRQQHRVLTVRSYGYRFEPGPAPELASGFTATEPTSLCEHESVSAFAMVDLDFRIAWASASVEQILEWHAGDLQGKVLDDLVHADDLHYVMAFRSALNQGHEAKMTFRLRTASGDYKRMQAAARPSFSSLGVLTSYMSEFRFESKDGASAIEVPPLPQAITLPMHALKTEAGNGSPAAEAADLTGV